MSDGGERENSTWSARAEGGRDETRDRLGASETAMARDGMRGEHRVRETERVARERSGSPDKDEKRTVVRRTASRRVTRRFDEGRSVRRRG